MTAYRYHPGDFVWCRFPEHEAPTRPGPRHIAYALVVSDPTATAPASMLAAYTTSQPCATDSAAPLGLFRFDCEQDAVFGQVRAFVLDTRRLAYLPITLQWFHRFDRLGMGVQCRAPKHLQQTIWQVAKALLTRHVELVERRGPLWPRGGDCPRLGTKNHLFRLRTAELRNYTKEPGSYRVRWRYRLSVS